MKEYKSHASGRQNRPSDMLSALENLKRIFQNYRFCLNEYAANQILMGMAIEAHTLALKMKVMLGRWKKYLPFHEAMDVEFDKWQVVVNEWIQTLNPTKPNETLKKYPWLVACKEDMMDLYALAKQEENFYEVGIKKDYKKEMYAYLGRMDDLLLEMNDDGKNDWRRQVNRMAVDSFSQTFSNYYFSSTLPDEDEEEELVVDPDWLERERVKTIVDSHNVETIAMFILLDLMEQLGNIQALFDSNLPDEMFIRLSVRLYYYHSPDSYQEGEKCVNKWRNNWPSAKLKENAINKKEELKIQLEKKPYGKELMEYVSLDTPNLIENADFGRFLFKNRKVLEMNDLRYIHKIFRELNLLNELIDEKSVKVTTPSGDSFLWTKQEQEIVDELGELAMNAQWKHISKEEVIEAIHKALKPVSADEKIMEMSATLWKLLQKRKNCDEKKSLRVTWLNIVGYCVKRGFLSGGSPALAKKFFPQCGNDDYKAIDKGRNPENNKNFQSVIPLLDACFGVGKLKC